MIELKGVGKKYGITKAVEDVSFTLPQHGTGTDSGLPHRAG